MCKTTVLLRLPVRLPLHEGLSNEALHRVISPGREHAVIKPISSRLAGVLRALAEFVTECLTEPTYNPWYAVHPTAASV